MSMLVKIRGFRGAERADIEVNPIALIGGLNFAGKSSVCQALAAAACNQPIPFFSSARPDKPRFTKADSKALLRGGMATGVASIEIDGEAVSTVSWPSLTASGTDAMHCSLVAAGLITPMEMEDLDRQRFFSTLLKADPTSKRSPDKPDEPSDLEAALIEAIPVLGELEHAESLAKVIAQVQTNGWDVAHRSFKENGAKRKGAWEHASGEAFGLKKAVGWKPLGWREDLADTSLEDLGTACTQAQAAVEKAIAAVATDAAELAALEQNAALEAGAWNALKAAEKDLERAQDDLAKKRKARAEIVIPTASACPHCGGLVDVVQNSVTHLYQLEQSTATQAQITALRTAAAQADGLVAKATDGVRIFQESLGTAKGKHEAIKGSGERLIEAKKRTGTTDAVDTARDLLAGLLKDKDLISRRYACETLAEQIIANQKLVDILAPDGLRRQKLQKALAKFNKETLGPLSAEAGFSIVTIDDDLEILYGARRYFLLSASEQYRVRAVVQIAVAVYDKS
ncbi:MAG: hypothetical protein U1A72_00795, partial [Sulfuritalea sp.]|nr:hypothetical protein [Sulfuritalea sp.]